MQENQEVEIEECDEAFQLEIIPAVHIDDILSIKYNLTSLVSSYADRDSFRVFIDDYDFCFEVKKESENLLNCMYINYRTTEEFEEFESDNCDDIFDYIINYTNETVKYVIPQADRRNKVSKLLSKVMILNSMLVEKIDQIDEFDSKNIEYCISMLEDIVKKHT
jgi:hypothetical protein